jgi:hypothetical protein
MKTPSTRNQQADRTRAKATLSAIKAKLTPQATRHAAADRQAERLRRLLTEHPRFSTSFDLWMDSRLGQIKNLRAD